MKRGKLSDLGRNERMGTVVLRRERVLKLQLEISMRKIRGLARRHKGWVLTICAVIAVIVFSMTFMVGFASTADFYPSSCLGSWNNVENALGAPRVPPGSPLAAYTALNSAVFSTGTAQMFCGNFSGQTSVADLQAKQLQSATLVLSWYVSFPGQTPAGSAGGGAAAAVDISPSPSSTFSSSTPSTTDNFASSTLEAATSAASISTATANNAASVIAPITTFFATTSADAATTTTTTTTTTTAKTTAEAATTSANTSTAIATDTTVTSSTPPPASPQAPPSPPPAPSSTPASASSTSWLFRLFPIAFADEASSVSTSGISSMPTATAAVQDTSSLLTASSAVQGVPATSSPAVPITVNTSAFENIALPAAAPGDFLGIAYSTDGVTWQPLVDINADNWNAARYPIPIKSWSELQHLQIAFVGLGASTTPAIYLDAVGVEASYSDSPAGSIAASDSGAGAAASSSSPSGTSTVFETNIASPAPAAPAGNAFGEIFDPAAKQHCSVLPFSNRSSHPGSVSYVLALAPPAAATSSSSSAAIPMEPPIYEAALGSLPAGVSGNIAPGGAAGIDTIGIDIGSNAVPGSYTAIVVYKEKQPGGAILPNFCQFNLVID